MEAFIRNHKKVIGSFIAGLTLLVFGAVFLFSMRDSFIAEAIRSYGPRILGVPLKLGFIKTDFEKESLLVKRIIIGNPPGFTNPNAFSARDITIKIDMSSLTKNVILVREIMITHPEITFENQSDGSNFDRIQQNVNRYIKETIGQKGGAGPGKRMIIQNLYIKDAKASVSNALLGGKTVTLALPDLHLRNLGKNNNGLTAAELAQQVLASLAGGITNVAGSVLGGAVQGIKQGVEAVGGALQDFFK